MSEPTKRHRSEYPEHMQEVGDLLRLWDDDGNLVNFEDVNQAVVLPLVSKSFWSNPLLDKVVGVESMNKEEENDR